MSEQGRQTAATAVFTREELTRRWRGLQAVLREREVDAAVLQQSRNVLYYGGIAVHGQVVVPLIGEPRFLVQIDAERASVVSPAAVTPSRGLRTLVDTLAELGVTHGRLGIEKDSLSLAAYERLVERMPHAVFVDVGADTLRLRMVKSPYEVELIRRSAAVSDLLFERLRQIARPGRTEIELHQELGALQRSLGGDGVICKHGANERTLEHGWLVSGGNTAQVSGYWLTMTGLGPSVGRPYGPTARVLREGDLLCYDVGTATSGYHSDSARTYVLGSADARQRSAWQVLCEMRESAIEAVAPGRPASAPYEAALAVARRDGMADYFMTTALHPFPYVGHGVGVEIDEPPLLSPRDPTVFESGMVLAVEPKIIVPGWGGLTIEDTVLVTDDGAEVLTRAGTELEITGAPA